MGANNSTRRVSYESDENENVTVVKGIRLSENLINRMRDGGTSPPPTKKPHAAATPPPPPPPPSTINTPLRPTPLLRPIPFPFDPVTSMPAPPPRVEAVAPAPPPPAPPAPEAKAKPLPPPPPPIKQPQVQPRAPPPVQEPPVMPKPKESAKAPPAPTVDEEALRKRISEELYQGLEQDRAKAEQDLQAWLAAEKAEATALARADARSGVPREVSRILEVERALAQDSLHQAVCRERAEADDGKRRAQRYAKQLEAREAELKTQDMFYRQQVARLEERSAQFYKVTTENYHSAADQVSSKFRRYDSSPVCQDLQSEILRCYQQNAGRTLHCSSIAQLYLQCVDQSKQNKALRTGG